MLRSLWSGLSGLRGHQVYLDNVGHNVANVNTLGYKKSVANFQDLLYETRRGGSSPSSPLGGINPMQVGHGSIIGSIDACLTQGDVQDTGMATNAAIEGAGYFALRSGSRQVYTRAGNFVFDADRNVVQSGTGYFLQGYAMTEDLANPGHFITSAALSDVHIPLGQKIPGQTTTTVGFRCNLDSRVGSYLPAGFRTQDVTSKAKFNAGTPPTLTEYTVSFAEGRTVDNFLSLEARDAGGAVAGTMTLSFGGVNDAGQPIMTISGTTPSTGIFAAPATVSYDATTGKIVVNNTTAGSEGTWEFNAKSIMDFQVMSLPVTVSVGPPPVTQERKFLAEFDDVAADGNRTIRLWGADAAGTAFGSAEVTVTMNPDGSFAAHGTPDTGWALADGNGASLLAGLGAPTFFPSTDGRSLVLKQNGAETAGASIAQRLNNGHSAPELIYDSLGNAHTLRTSWEKIDNNSWRWRSWLENDDGSVSDITVTDADGKPATGILSFDGAGRVKGDVSPTLKIAFGAVGAEEGEVALDFLGKSFGGERMNGVTQFGSSFTTRAQFQDGRAMGVLTGFAYQTDGTVMGTYDNGSNLPLYRVPLALFKNPEGLERLGENILGVSLNSGEPVLTMAQEGGAGKIRGSSVEGSNVDIVEEFVNLIRGQRGYQANARIVTTSDQVLEETINLKR